MKVLVVFISVLVLGVYSKVLPDDDEVRVIVVPLESKELDSPATDSEESVLYLVEEPDDAESEEVAPIGLQRSFDIGNSDALNAAVQRVVNNGVTIPILTQACTNSVSGFICGLLGFKNGTCAATNLCHCYN